MAELGHNVLGVDVDAERIALLQRNQAPFFEPGLPEMLASASATGHPCPRTALLQAKQ